MTEERKIITEEEWSWGASIIGWTDLDPAPPKDWKPLCYRSETEKMFGCWHNKKMYASCRGCPYKR